MYNRKSVFIRDLDNLISKPLPYYDHPVRLPYLKQERLRFSVIKRSKASLINQIIYIEFDYKAFLNVLNLRKVR